MVGGGWCYPQRGLIGWSDTLRRSPATPSARPQIDVDCVDGVHPYPLRGNSGDQGYQGRGVQGNTSSQVTRVEPHEIQAARLLEWSPMKYKLLEIYKLLSYQRGAHEIQAPRLLDPGIEIQAPRLLEGRVPRNTTGHAINSIILPYSYTPIQLYPHTVIPPYSYTPMQLYPHTVIPPCSYN